MDPVTILALIGTLIPLINNGVKFIAESKKAIEGNAEWTDEQRAQFQAEIDKLQLNVEEWQKPQPL